MLKCVAMTFSDNIDSAFNPDNKAIPEKKIVLKRSGRRFDH